MKNTKQAAIPTSIKGRERRESILDCAERLLASEGYAGFTLRGVAECSAVRLSNVQYYFPSKASLLTGLLQRSLERASQELVQPQQGNTDLAQLIDYVLAQQGGAQCQLFWELWALSARDREVEQILMSFYEGYRRALAEAVSGYTLIHRQQELSATDALNRATLMMSLLEGVSLFRSRLTDPDFDAVLKHSLIRIASGD
ncbi:TetR/AcrR family transcriptional regulator [Pseudohongiella sp. SYSU M77423]|uniref:TetR/AcrR family transcriptional regulator n=1 Tax=Pseudohongiella sp. SYSU M77423 TaxID=3042312 RepID=UPI0024817DE9|nr:TetR/AcrR family transcriptional regulator [Pseudohongiella sp. SYSU M77423]MDH7942564.1 TetR/AcrR family transcriptional regulator [Pseudohongiella sp. SYSU M77423]